MTTLAHQHNTLYTMYTTQYTSAQCAGPDHTVKVQHVLSGAPVCNMLSDALLFLLCTLDNTQFNATCNMLSALHCWLCSATDHTDVCTPVSGADGVLRPSLLGRQRQRHCQCLNLHRNTPPQCHQTALPAWETTTATLPMSQSLSQCSSSMSSDFRSTDITMT